MGQGSEKLLVIPVLTLWSSASNGPLTSVLMPGSVPNVLIVMVCNLLLLSVPDRNAGKATKEGGTDQKKLGFGMSLFKGAMMINGLYGNSTNDIHALFHYST